MNRRVQPWDQQVLDEQRNQLIESAPVGMLLVGRQGEILVINTEIERMFGYPRDELLGQPLEVLLPEALRSAHAGLRAGFMADPSPRSMGAGRDLMGRRKDGSEFPLEVGLNYLRGTGDGKPLYIASVADISERQSLERRLRDTRDKFSDALETRQALINSLPAHIALLDEDGTIIDINQQWRHFGYVNQNLDPGLGLGRNYLQICLDATGDSAEDALATAAGLQALLSGERDTFTLEYPCHSPQRLMWFRLTANRLVQSAAHDRQFGAVVMHVDITERKLAERDLGRLVYEDSLTGLLSRQGFFQAFSAHIRTRGWRATGMLVMLDMRDQRAINDAHGFEVGDALLSQVATRLWERAGENGIVARTGGDEFIVFLPSPMGLDAGQQGMVLEQVFQTPFTVGGTTVELSAWFSYTLLGEQQRSAQTLLHEVEVALFAARTRGLPDWYAYTQALDLEARERIQLTRDLRQALEQDQFQLHYQPKVDLATGRMVACEALLRWEHPQRGLQSPGVFIPLAEQSQLIGPIGAWVLFQACRHLREWQDAGLEVVRVSVNVSVVQFKLGGFTDLVRRAIETFRIDPACLTLEITESVFEQESCLLKRQLQELHGLGVRLSLDDFGTGYSSLLYLQQYPFDEIKIDMGFVKRVPHDAFSREIVTAVLGIAGAIGAETMAEGIENAEVRDVLIKLGCRQGQGFHYSLALEVEDFRWLLESRTTLPVGAG